MKRASENEKKKKKKFVFVFVASHVSEPYNRTDFTFVPKIPILFCREREVALQMGRRALKACLALFILFLISSSVPPSLLTTLPR